MRICVFNKIPRGLLCTLKFEKPWNRVLLPSWLHRTHHQIRPLPHMSSSFLRYLDLRQTKEPTTPALAPQAVAFNVCFAGLDLRSLFSFPLFLFPIFQDSVAISRYSLYHTCLLTPRQQTWIQVKTEGRINVLVGFKKKWNFSLKKIS